MNAWCKYEWRWWRTEVSNAKVRLNSEESEVELVCIERVTQSPRSKFGTEPAHVD